MSESRTTQLVGRPRPRPRRRAGAALACTALLVPLLGATAPGAAAQEPAPAGPVCTADVPPATFLTDRHEVPQVHRASADCAAFLRIALGRPLDDRRTALLPRDEVSRAAMASFLARTLLVGGVQLPPPSLEPFYDVPQGSEHEQAIQRLRAAGIVNGRGPATYAPAEPVSRGQTAALLLRAAAFARGVDAASLERATSPFTDAAGTHAAAIGGAHALGLVRGVTSTQYAPAATTTRAQMTSLLVRVLESEVRPVRPCTNDLVGYTVRPPASWTVDRGDTRPACSIFAPPDAGGSAVVVREDPRSYEQLLSEGPSASAEHVVTREQTLLLGSRRAAVQEREATGRGEQPEGRRSTVWLVDRADRTLVGETQEAPAQDYRTNQGVLVRMLLSLELPEVDPLAFVPPSSVQTAPPGDGSMLGLAEVRTGRHAGFDRVVLEMAGAGRVGWRVAYTDDPRYAGSGDPVEVAGDGTLQISVQGVGYPFDTGVPAYAGPDRLTGPGTSIPEVVVGVLFEGLQGAFVGTRDELPYRVFRLSGPERLVIDVAHPPAG
jgi:hypothetical protein